LIQEILYIQKMLYSVKHKTGNAVVADLCAHYANIESNRSISKVKERLNIRTVRIYVYSTSLNRLNIFVIQYICFIYLKLSIQNLNLL
jgi:hypothetical protein